MQAVMRPTCAPTTQPIQPPTLAPMRAKKVLISISSRPAFGASCDHGGRGVGRTIGQSPRQALSSAIRVRSQSRGPPWPRVGSESRTTSATDRTRRPITGLELEGLPQGPAEVELPPNCHGGGPRNQRWRLTARLHESGRPGSNRRRPAWEAVGACKQDVGPLLGFRGLLAVCVPRGALACPDILPPKLPPSSSSLTAWWRCLGDRCA